METYFLYIIIFYTCKPFANHRSLGFILALETYFNRLNTGHDKGTLEKQIGQIHRFLSQKIYLWEVAYPCAAQVGELKNYISLR